MSKRDALELILRGGAILALLWGVMHTGVLISTLQMARAAELGPPYAAGSSAFLLFFVSIVLWFGAGVFAASVEEPSREEGAHHPQLDLRRLVFAGVGVFFLLRSTHGIVAYLGAWFWPDSPELIFARVRPWDVIADVTLAVISLGLILGTAGIRRLGSWFWGTPRPR